MKDRNKGYFNCGTTLKLRNDKKYKYIYIQKRFETLLSFAQTPAFVQEMYNKLKKTSPRSSKKMSIPLIVTVSGVLFAFILQRG